MAHVSDYARSFAPQGSISTVAKIICQKGTPAGVISQKDEGAVTNLLSRIVAVAIGLPLVYGLVRKLKKLLDKADEKTAGRECQAELFRFQRRLAEEKAVAAREAAEQEAAERSMVSAALAAPVASRSKNPAADAYSFKKEDLWVNQGDTEITCLICTESLGSDPAQALNLCGRKGFDRCACLVHRKCYLDPDHAMSDIFRKCLICHGPADPALVKLRRCVRYELK